MSKKQDFIIKHIWWIFTLWFILLNLCVVLIQNYSETNEITFINTIESSKQDLRTSPYWTQEEIDNCFKKIKYWPDVRIWICYNSINVDSFYKLINISWNLVNDAWWSNDLNYMIVNLNGINYHYCGFSRSNWIDFSKSKDKDAYYIDKIKSNFDCRNWWLPLFCDTSKCEEENTRYIKTEKSFPKESNGRIYRH